MALNRKMSRAAARTHLTNFSLDGLEGFDIHGKTAAVVGCGRVSSLGGSQAQQQRVVSWKWTTPASLLHGIRQASPPRALSETGIPPHMRRCKRFLSKMCRCGEGTRTFRTSRWQSAFLLAGWLTSWLAGPRQHSCLVYSCDSFSTKSKLGQLSRGPVMR